MTDGAPTKVVQYVPVYAGAPLNGLYGSEFAAGVTAYAPDADVHLPKGHLKAGRKNWQRVKSWVPPAAK